jgi:hypothetical protein
METTLDNIIVAANKLLCDLKIQEDLLTRSLHNVHVATQLHIKNEEEAIDFIKSLLKTFAEVLSHSNLSKQVVDANQTLISIKSGIRSAVINTLLLKMTPEYALKDRNDDKEGEPKTKSYTELEMYHWDKGQVIRICWMHTPEAQRLIKVS